MINTPEHGRRLSGGALKTFDLFKKVTADVLEPKGNAWRISVGLVYAVLAIIAILEVHAWLSGGGELQLATSLPRHTGLRAIFSLRITATPSATLSRVAVDVKGKERKVCNIARFHAMDLFGAENIGEVGKIECALPGVPGRAWYDAAQDRVGPYSSRRAPGQTSPGLDEKFSSPSALSGGPDKFVLLLYFDSSAASRQIYEHWGRGVDRVSGKMQFDEKAGTKTQVAFQQVNCDDPAGERICGEGPVLLPSVVLYQRGAGRTHALLPDDVEEMIAFITVGVKNMAIRPRNELRWPLTLQGWVRLPNVPGQVSLIHNASSLSPNFVSATWSVEIDHFLFEADQGVAMHAGSRLNSVPRSKRRTISPLTGEKRFITLPDYHHFHGKLVPSVQKGVAKPDYHMTVAGVRQDQNPKLPPAIFRLNYDISTVGFVATTEAAVRGYAWYHLVCRLAGLLTGGHLISVLTGQMISSLVGMS